MPILLPSRAASDALSMKRLAPFVAEVRRGRIRGGVGRRSMRSVLWCGVRGWVMMCTSYRLTMRLKLGCAGSSGHGCSVPLQKIIRGLRRFSK